MKPLLHLLFALSVTAAVSTTSAHAQDYRREGDTRVTLFGSPGFRGQSLTLYVGEQWDDLNHVRFANGRIANNRVSSILIEGPARVTLYDYRGFVGESITITRSVYDLADLPQYRNGDWDNELSSLTVRKRDNRPIGNVTCPPSTSGNFGSGRNRGSDYGYGYGNSTHNHNSPQPGRGHSEVGHKQGHPYAGDNRVEEIYLDGETALVVREAYRDILGREPDTRGLENYVEIMHRRGWSESRLRKELRRSDEFRRVVVPRVVNNAYREILDRAPDPAGNNFYSSRMIYKGWTEQRVRAALKNSPEYRQRMHKKSARTPGRNWGYHTG